VNGETWKGKVKSLGDLPVPSQQELANGQQSVTSYPFTVRLDKHSDKLRQGYHVTAEITVAKHKDVPAVDKDTILHKNGKDFVFVVKNGKLDLRRIVTGFVNGRYKEVEKGLHIGDTLVINPSDSLEDGMVVNHDQTR
jgi:HlyD family secretion protein